MNTGGDQIRKDIQNRLRKSMNKQKGNAYWKRLNNGKGFGIRQTILVEAGNLKNFL
jgi:hypothetical protein